MENKVKLKVPLRIKKHGTVTFNNKKIVRIDGFEVYGGTTQQFEDYIKESYVFKRQPPQPMRGNNNVLRRRY